jgi:hypothetical protein
MTWRERAPARGPDVVASTPGGSMKHEVEAARGAVIGSKVPAIEEG